MPWHDPLHVPQPYNVKINFFVHQIVTSLASRPIPLPAEQGSGLQMLIIKFSTLLSLRVGRVNFFPSRLYICQGVMWHVAQSLRFPVSLRL